MSTWPQRYVVLSVNYRSGIGTAGIREAPGRAGRGASDTKTLSLREISARACRCRSFAHRLWGEATVATSPPLLGAQLRYFRRRRGLPWRSRLADRQLDGKNISPELTKLAHESSP